MSEEKKSCYGCAYKRNVPGDAHIACSFNFLKSDKPIPRGDVHGIRNGWYMFPVNYDPTWMKDECLAHSETSDPKMVVDPLMNLLNLLR